MGKRDPRVDAYMSKSAEFARPVLTHLREAVHGACPDVEETIKWGMPFFLKDGILCHMAAFKAHCAFGFWKGSGIVGADAKAGDEAMGQFGRITRVADLPASRVMAGYIKAAAKRNAAASEKPVTAKRKAKPPLPVPDDLARALRRNRKAAATFEGFSASNRREYIEWITGARAAATRQRRLDQAIEWMAEGKVRNWKYVNC